jgi:hypothetical protein
MAIPWLAVLKSVPWKEVISNAPLVANGAKKLWNTVGNKPPVAASAAEPAETPQPAESVDLVALQSRLAKLESASAELHSQMLASSELIKTLAEQNTELVKRVEANRQRVVWLGGATVVIAILSALALLICITSTQA